MTYTYGYDDQTDERLLATCKKGWKSRETPCGPGSELANARHAIAAIDLVVKQYWIESVNDAGAGDLNWIKYVSLPNYNAFDLVPRHDSVTQFDLTKEILPRADLILCRHVLNHLSILNAERVIQRFSKSLSPYLLMTNCDNQKEYWKHYKFEPFKAPMAIYNDCQKWSLELYDLQRINI